MLCQLTSVVNYGGRITDDKDMRTSDIVIADFFTPRILDSTYKFSRSGTYYSMDPSQCRIALPFRAPAHLVPKS